MRANERAIGTKVPIGVDAVPERVHTMVGGAGNGSDLAEAGNVLHGGETTWMRMLAALGWISARRCRARNPTNRIDLKRGRVQCLAELPQRDAAREREDENPQVRAIVEHPCPVMKTLFWHQEMRCRGLGNRAAQLLSVFVLANLILGRRLTARQRAGASGGRKAPKKIM